jgi:hypothetical protein
MLHVPSTNRLNIRSVLVCKEYALLPTSPFNLLEAGPSYSYKITCLQQCSPTLPSAGWTLEEWHHAELLPITIPLNINHGSYYEQVGCVRDIMGMLELLE